MSERIWRRIGAAGGIAYVLLAIVGNDVLGSRGQGESPAIDAPVSEIGTYVAGLSPSTTNWAGLYLELIGLLAFVVFVATLWSLLRRAEGEHGFLSATVLGAGVVSVAVKLASIPPALSALYRGDEFDPQLLTALIDMNNAAFAITWMTEALLLTATAVIVIRTGVLPRWLGWAAALIALGLLVAAPNATSGAAFIPMALTLLWILVASAILVWRAADPPAATRRSKAAPVAS